MAMVKYEQTIARTHCVIRMQHFTFKYVQIYKGIVVQKGHNPINCCLGLIYH